MIMSKDLTNSQVDRKNVLNNNLAIKELYGQLGFTGVLFEGKYRFTKQQIARYFEVDARTVERLLEAYSKEIMESGYEQLQGKCQRVQTNSKPQFQGKRSRHNVF